MSSQTKPKSATSSQRPPRRPRARPLCDFIAAVRFNDGRSELFAVKNADTHADARCLVMAELLDVAAVLITERRA